MAISMNNPMCCGCGACVDICPNKAISLKQDNETFLYPYIDPEKCINCGLCDRVCPLNFSDFQDTKSIRCYVGTHNDTDIIKNSSSGGAFSALTEIFSKRGYIIYGAQYDENYKVHHSYATSMDDCQKFRKSKYVQSNTLGCFKSVERNLSDGKKVLFSGVSCQIAALKSYLKTKRVEDNNLITVNVLCHGVSSQAIFDRYLNEIQEKEHSDIICFYFKNKNTDGRAANSRSSYIEFSNGNKYNRTVKNDPYLRGYYRRLFYRPSCASCRFAKKERVSDFTIADAWGIEQLYPEMNPHEGVSLITLNTEKAKMFCNELNTIMKLIEVSSDWALDSQEMFVSPTKMHNKRDEFFKRLNKQSFEKAVYNCTKPSVIHFLRAKASAVKKKIIGKSI